MRIETLATIICFFLSISNLGAQRVVWKSNILPYTQSVSQLFFSANDSLLLVSGIGYNIKLVNPTDGIEVWAVTTTKGISSVALNNNATKIYASLDSDYQTRILHSWNRESNRETSTTIPGTSNLYFVFHNYFNSLTLVSDAQENRLWVNSSAFNGAGKYVWFTSTTQLYDMSRDSLLGGEGSNYYYSRDSCTIAIGYKKYGPYSMNDEYIGTRITSPFGKVNINDVVIGTFTVDKRYYLCSSGIYHIASAKLLKPYPISTSSLAISERYVVCLQDSAIAIRDFYDGSLLSDTPLGFTGRTLTLSYDKRYCAVGGDSGYVALLELPQNLPQQISRAAFSNSTASIYVRERVQFTSQVFPIDSVLYQWDFGDGTNSTEANPFHQYITPGRYAVSLLVKWRDTTIFLQKDSLITVKAYTAPGFDWIQRHHFNTVTSLAFSKDGQHLVCAGIDSSISIIASSNGNRIQSFQTKTTVNLKRSASFIQNDSAVFLTELSSRDGTCEIGLVYSTLRTTDGSTISHKAKGYGRATNMHSSSSRDFIGYNNMCVCLAEDSLIATAFNAYHTYTYYDFLGHLLGSNTYFSGGILSGSQYDNTLYARRTMDVNTYCYISPQAYACYSLAIDSRENIIISSENNSIQTVYPSRVVVRGLRDSIEKLSFNDTTYCLRLAPDGFRLLTKAGLWDWKNAELLTPLNLGYSSQYEFFPDGVHLTVFFSRDSAAISIFDIQKNLYIFSLPKLPFQATAMALSPDGKRIAVGMANGSVAMYSLPTFSSQSQTDFIVGTKERTNAKLNIPLRFNNLSLPLKDGSEYEWDFGDGNMSSEFSPIHSYSKEGTYSVLLRKRKNGTLIGVENKPNYIVIPKPLSVDEHIKQEIQLLPQPASDVLRCTTETTEIYTARLYDAIGRLRIETILHNGSFLSTHDLENGVYYLVFWSKRGEFSTLIHVLH